MSYLNLLHPVAYEKLSSYLCELKNGKLPGKYLQDRLATQDISNMDETELLELLVNTKRPQIFAESDIRGDGTDWNRQELAILGDLGIAVPVTVYDNGEHNNPTIHDVPFKATLLFTCGALLSGDESSDWHELVSNRKINIDAYHELYERRLTPLFFHVNEMAIQQGRDAIITIPGLGCGQFAGIFRGQLESRLCAAIMSIIEKYAKQWRGIRLIRLSGPGFEKNLDNKYENVSFRVRQFLFDGTSLPQLCRPQQYEEEGEVFKGCDLYSMVAWDHVSWPGNDFYAGSRATDDGVKAAATNAIAVLTGFAGKYDKNVYKYQPPKPWRLWRDVVQENELTISVCGQIKVGW